MSRGVAAINKRSRMSHRAARTRARRRAKAGVGARRKISGKIHFVAQAQRRGRNFLDYLRNGRGTTAIGTYSPRAREGFPIAAPVTWARVERGIRPDAFTMERPFRP
jgi:DNA primase